MIVALDRFQIKVKLETKKGNLKEGSSVYLHFGRLLDESPLSVGGMVNRADPNNGLITIMLSLSTQEFNRLRGVPDTSSREATASVPRPEPPRPTQQAKAPVTSVPPPRPEPPRPSPTRQAEAPVSPVPPRPEPLRPTQQAKAPVTPVRPRPEPLRPTQQVEARVTPVPPRPEPPRPSPTRQAEAPVTPVQPRPEPPPQTQQVEARVTPVPPRPEPLRPSPAQQAEALAARGDNQGAWKLCYEALQTAPEDISLWYALGLALSRLNQRKEAEEVFQHVARRGNPDSGEVMLARQWLFSAEVLAKPEASTIASERVRLTTDKGVVKGKVTWGEPEPAREALIILQGIDESGQRSHTRLPLGQFYQFEHLSAGSYRLVGGVGDHWLWDVRLTVEPGKEIVLNLSKDSSTNPTALL